MGALPAAAAHAFDAEEPDPTDLVPRRFSPSEFEKLDENELYMARLAVERGRRILIDGCTASQSRAIIRATGPDRAAALRMMRQSCT